MIQLKRYVKMVVSIVTGSKSHAVNELTRRIIGKVFGDAPQAFGYKILMQLKSARFSA